MPNSEPVPNIYPDPHSVPLDVSGPSVVLFAPGTDMSAMVLGWDAEGKELSFAEVRAFPQLLRRITRWTTNGRDLMTELRAYIAWRQKQ